MKKVLTPRTVASLAFVIVGLLLPIWVSSPYYLGIFVNILVYAVLSIAFTMTFRTGLVHLGLTAFWGLGAYVTAVATTRWHFTFWESVPVAIIICAIVGLGLGYILIGRGRGGFNFVILSSVIGMLFPIVIGSVGYLGGYTGISNIPAPEKIHLGGLTLDFGTAKGYYYLAAIIFIVVVLVCAGFYRSWTGRAWKSIGMNPRLAESFGVDVFHYRLLAIVVGAGLVGLIGSFYSSYITFVLPAQFGMWQNVYIQAYAVLGGIGFAVLGPLLGATVMTVVPQLVQFSNLVAPLFVGVVLILLILFFPEGLLGIVTHREWAVRMISPVRVRLRRKRPEAIGTVPIAVEADGAEGRGDDA
jgi:branched-chain amino acid transport system permease protein